MNHFLQMVTLFFGANDLCSGQCYKKEQFTPAAHAYKLMKALDYLDENLPRTLVNLVPVLGKQDLILPLPPFSLMFQSSKELDFHRLKLILFIILFLTLSASSTRYHHEPGFDRL